jgi:hypothetical protein
MEESEEMYSGTSSVPMTSSGSKSRKPEGIGETFEEQLEELADVLLDGNS